MSPAENFLNKDASPRGADVAFKMKGAFYALAGVFLVSTNFVTAKYALGGFNPETFTLLWLAAASFYSLLIITVTGHGKQIALDVERWKPMALLGIVTGTGMLFTWTGLKMLDPSFAALISRSGPVIAVFMGVIFLKERFLGREILPVTLMAAGGFISVMGRGEVVVLGVLFTLLGAFSYGVQHLIAKKYALKITPDTINFYRVFFALLPVSVWVFSTGKVDLNAGLSYWLVLFAGAFLGPCASHILTFRSYLYWGLSRTSIVNSAQPLFVLPLAYLFLGQFPNLRELSGGGLILLGSFWVGYIHLSGKRAFPDGVFKGLIKK